MNIGSGEARKPKAIEDVRRGWGWFEDQIGDLPARFLTANDPETFRKKLPAGRLASKTQETVKSEGRAMATVNSYLGTLKAAAFDLAFKNGNVECNPVSIVKLTRRTPSACGGEAEEAGLMAALPKDYHALPMMALHTGLRKSEQLRLKWVSVDFQRQRLTVRESKSAEGRHILANHVVIEVLKSLPRMLHNPFVFYGRSAGGPLKNGIKHSDWLKYSDKPGLKTFTPR